MANRGRRTSRVRRFLKLFAIGTVSIIVIGLVALWLAFQRIPDWYRPVALTEAVAQEAQRTFTNFTDTVSDRIVEGEPFDVTIEQDAVNTWLAAAPELRAERRRVSPERLRDPAVAFEPGRIRIGAHINHNGWETIAGAVLDSEGKDETYYLDPLDQVVETGITPAQGLLDAYHGYWNGDIDALFKDCMY